MDDDITDSLVKIKKSLDDVLNKLEPIKNNKIVNYVAISGDDIHFFHNSAITSNEIGVQNYRNASNKRYLSLFDYDKKIELAITSDRASNSILVKCIKYFINNDYYLIKFNEYPSLRFEKNLIIH
jgi:hypothetical protein